MESGEIEQPVSSLMRGEFEAYAERMKQIRSLATPALDEIRIPEDYSQALRVNFQRIGEMAAENRRIITDYVQPVLTSGEILSPDDKNAVKRNGRKRFPNPFRYLCDL